ncbi:MAG: hypothetical protein ACFCUG_07855 [Thiotrichales bacterium]
MLEIHRLVQAPTPNTTPDRHTGMDCRYPADREVTPDIVPNAWVPTIPAGTTNSIYSDRLPTVKGGFFGSIAELQLLNDAWHGEENPHPNPSPRGRGAKETRIIQFIAPSGTGKTKLLRHWLDDTTGIDALIAWSFYSQGASEDKQTPIWRPTRTSTPMISEPFPSRTARSSPNTSRTTSP